MIGSSLRSFVSQGTVSGRYLAGSLLLMLMAGCGGSRSFGPRTEFIPFTPEQKTELQAQRTHAYRIQEGDVLRVQFAYEKPLDQDGVIVLTDGTVNLVGIDSIRLAGLTMSEADSALTAAYSREYREPALSVMIQETQGRRVYVLGEVRTPGFYKLPMGGTDVMSAIALASGFTDDAARDGTIIVRITPEGYQFQEVNLDSFGTPQFAPAAMVGLRSFDVVYVPRSGSGDFAYLTRSVLSGLSYVTRMAYDVYNISSGNVGRF